MSEQPVTFEAVIVPHRSLDRRGFRRLAVALVGLSLAMSLGLLLAGAWPVIGFSGIEVALALWLIGRHAFGPSGSEVVILTDAELRVLRVDRRGRRREARLASAWLRVDVDERPGRVPALVLRSRRRALEIADVLGEEEKRALAAELRRALDRQRSPVFDNPQLRDVSPPPAPST